MSLAHFGWNTPFAFTDTVPGALAADAAAQALAAQPGDTTAAPGHAARFDHAIGLLEAGEWSLAFDALGALANLGHAPAARMALMLAHRGAVLFGGSFPATRREQDRWQRHSA
jgi:hypothetical protein